MTITLMPEVETAIAEQARRQGTTPERLVSESLQKLFAVPALTPDEQGISLSDHGISPAQAAELRASFATFAGEWERPEMDVYDDYDAAKARLEANPAYAEVPA